MSSSNLHCDDKIKQMIEYLQYKNGKSSIINQKATPRSGSNFGSAFPTQVYSSTFSPNSNKSGKRVRNSALSPSIMSKDVYSVTHQRKKSSQRKHSSSRKRTSLGGKQNYSKYYDDVTIFTSSNKPCLMGFNNKSSKKKRNSCKKKKKRDYIEHPHAVSSYSINSSAQIYGDQKSQNRIPSRVSDIKASSGPKKGDHKRTMTIINDQISSGKENSLFNKKIREKAIFKILSSKKFAKKITPNVQPQTERGIGSMGLFVPGRSTSGDKQMYTISSLGNRAHLLATQRDMFYPSTLTSRPGKDDD